MTEHAVVRVALFAVDIGSTQYCGACDFIVAFDTTNQGAATEWAGEHVNTEERSGVIYSRASE